MSRLVWLTTCEQLNDDKLRGRKGHVGLGWLRMVPRYFPRGNRAGQLTAIPGGGREVTGIPTSSWCQCEKHFCCLNVLCSQNSKATPGMPLGPGPCWRSQPLWKVDFNYNGAELATIYLSIHYIGH